MSWLWVCVTCDDSDVEDTRDGAMIDGLDHVAAAHPTEQADIVLRAVW